MEETAELKSEGGGTEAKVVRASQAAANTHAAVLRLEVTMRTEMRPVWPE